MTIELNSVTVLPSDDATNNSLMTALDNFSKILSQYGINVIPYNRNSLEILNTVPQAKKIEIEKFYRNWASWIAIDSNETDSLEINLDKEKKFLKKALDFYGLWVHEDFWNTLKKGQIIEVYGQEMVQLYRNLEFFKYCSYSLLDLAVFEWYHLWERPQRVFDSMLEIAILASTERIDSKPYNIPKFVLREIMEVSENSPESRRACLVEFLNIGSVYRGLENKPAGAIATSTGETIAIGAEARNIQFI